MIDIDHVSFQYSGAEQENLQDFNLQIKKGECVVLTGESGCGKTCVTRLINTLIPHFYEGEMSGAVLIDGVDTRTIQPHDLSDKIGSVFQNPRSQFFSLDTDSEIVFGMENKGMPYQVMLNRYQQTIRELHIEKLKDRNLFDLSGGQKQTIAFASVYALNPDIFVLDEPSSNLDPEAIQELRRLLLLIKAQGKTIVGSEHRLYFLNGIADRIVLMEHGKLKQSWSARDFALLSTEQIKALGTYLPMVIMTGYVDDMSTSNGVSAEYLTELHSFMNGTMVVIIAVVTFVAGIVGALIAKGVFKKHFQKAGIV